MSASSGPIIAIFKTCRVGTFAASQALRDKSALLLTGEAPGTTEQTPLSPRKIFPPRRNSSLNSVTCLAPHAYQPTQLCSTFTTMEFTTMESEIVVQGLDTECCYFSLTMLHLNS